MHARLAAERRDADPGVVGERRHAGRAARVPRLGERVFDEGRVRLFGLGDAELRLRNDLEAERLEHLPELAELARIAGGDDQAFQDRSAAFCAATSSRMPLSASAIMASSSRRLKG